MARNTVRLWWALSSCLIAILALSASASAHHKANHSGGPEWNKETSAATEEEPAAGPVLFADSFGCGSLGGTPGSA